MKWKPGKRAARRCPAALAINNKAGPRPEAIKINQRPAARPVIIESELIKPKGINKMARSR